MIVKLINCDDTLWMDALKYCNHDVYQTPGWIKASKHCDEGVPLAIYVESDNQKALFPFLKRKIINSLWDATSPYGYSGPIFSRECSSGWPEVALAAAITILRELDCVSWFIRLHPLLNENWSSTIGVVDHGPTVSINLMKSAEEHWRETMSGHRSDINKAKKSGVSIRQCTTPECLDAFIRIYHETMIDIGASSYYFFKKEYFKDLVKFLSNDLLILMASENNEYIGCSMFTLNRSSKIIQYHLSGTASAFRHRQPSKLILHAAREWGRDNGFSRLHLGGGVGAQEDALFKFKRGFSADTHIFQSLRIIVNEEQYSCLCREQGVSQVAFSGFFPAYRQI